MCSHASPEDSGSPATRARAPTRRPAQLRTFTSAHTPHTRSLHLPCHISPSDVTLTSTLVTSALVRMGSTSGHEITHPITVILDGPASYHAWSQNMTVFLKGRRLWRYVTGDIPKPVPRFDTDSDSSDSDSVANAVVQQSPPSIGNRSSSLVFLGHSTASMWEQLAAADPPLRYAEDIDLFAKYKDRRRFTQFMMGLREDFEPTRAALLSRSPLPSLDVVVKELISKENRRHDITECYCKKKKDDKRKQHQSHGTFPHPQVAAVSSAPVDDPVVTISQLENIFHRYMFQPSPVLSVTSGNKSWLLDSVCCNHMTPHASHFSQKTPLAPSLIIYTADSSHMSVSHIGTISSPDLTIPDTYLVPKLSLNLLSVGQLCELGLDLHFSNHDVDVQDSLTGKLLGTGRKIGRLFELCNLQIPSHMVSSSVAAITTLSPDLWHSRLGHASLSRLQLLASQGHLGSVFRSDNAQEYHDKSFLSILDSNSTLPHYSCPYTSQQNGRAERKLRHILDVVRTLLISAPVLERFWGEAALTTIYTINRIPSPTTYKKSPFELLYNKLPDYSSLRVFGCVCFVSLLPINETNLNQGLGCVVFLAMTFSSRQHFPFISSSMTPIFIDHSIDLYPDPVRDSAPPPSSSDVPSLVLSPVAGSPDSDPTPSAPSESLTDIRHSTRVRAPPSHLSDYHYYFALATLHEPHTYRKTSTNPLWQQAMADELDALYKTHTWDMITLPPSKFAVGCKWVYKIKTRADGSVEHYKARLPLFQMDVKNAFLNGDLLEEVYMQPPPGYPDSQNQGFTPSSYDSALFIRHTSTGITLILLYVDDIIITGDDTAGIRDLQKFLSQQFEMKDLGTLSYVLGLEVTFSSDSYYLSQAKYAFDLLSKAGFTDSKTVSTPLEFNVKLNTTDGEPLSDATLYRQLVGSLIYLTVTHPDLAYAIHLVSQFMFAPRSTHYVVVLRILRYIKGTLFHGLHFSAQSSLELRASADVDWAEDPTDRRSTTGYCFLLGSSLISWRKQSVVARSSTEAEYRALADATTELLWLRWLLADMGAPQTTSTPIRSAIHIAHNNVFHERTKHIEIDCHFIRHHLQQSALHLLSVSSEDQLADVFTKSHPPRRLRDLVSKLKMASSMDKISLKKLREASAAESEAATAVWQAVWAALAKSSTEEATNVSHAVQAALAEASTEAALKDSSNDQVLTMTASSSLPSTNTHINTQTPIFLLSNISNYVTIKLDHSNYLMWKFQITGILDAYSLLDHLEDPTPCPSQFLFSHSETETQEVNPLYTSVSRSNIVNLKRELNSIKKNSDSVTDYLHKIKEARNKLVSVGIHIDDEEILHIVLQGLPSEFHSFTSAMLTKNEAVKFEELHTLMKTEEDLLRSATDNSKEIAHMAMVANKSSQPTYNTSSNAQFGGHRGRGRNQNRGRGGYGGRFQTSNSGRGGGSSHGSFINGGNFSNFTPVSPNPQTWSSNPSSRPICQICYKPGHTALDCYQRMNFSYQGRHPPAKLAAMATATPPSPYPHQTTWISDTGATDHFTPDLHNIPDNQAYSDSQLVSVGNGNQLPISHSEPPFILMQIVFRFKTFLRGSLFTRVPVKTVSTQLRVFHFPHGLLVSTQSQFSSKSPIPSQAALHASYTASP
uniref:Integrase catalytic domain-containing protein n=1 Tax=Fagus sylvatica TaxID=28930 RepID=A0A2N9J418_FAGSY